MKRFPFFFFLAFVVVVAMIGAALLPLAPQKAVVVEARNERGALIFDAASLNALRPATGFPVTLMPGPRGDQKGPRLASFNALDPSAKNTKGARLLIGPDTQAALGQGSFKLAIIAKGVANTPAKAMAVGLVQGGAVNWVAGEVKPTATTIQFNVQSGGQSTSALAIWPAVEGNGHGIEILSIAFIPSLAPQ
jgi:hypothetical protein